MDRTEYKVETLVDLIERGELALPEMQRGYVWPAPRVRDLLDSLYRNYPSGAILIWDTGEDVPTRTFALDQAVPSGKTQKLLLDGQQRLTSLTAVIRGKPIFVSGRKRPIDILFNLEHPDDLALFLEVDEKADDDIAPQTEDESVDEIARRLEKMAFVVSSPKLTALQHWVSVSEVFKTNDNAVFLQKAGVEGFSDSRFNKYNDRLNKLRAIRDYPYRVDLLDRRMNYEEVTEIFVRVNSLGAKLRSSDLALAQITAKWRDSLAGFEAFREEVKRLGFDLDLGVHLKAMIAFATGQCRFKTVHSLKTETLQSAWNEAREGMRFAVDWSKSNLKIDSDELLSSPFLLITLAYFGHRCHYRIESYEAKQLMQWALIANAKGRYSRGSTETFLDQDLASIARGEGAASLLRLLTIQMGRLEVLPADLEGRTTRSGLFKSMFLAFRAKGAKDWYSSLEIALNHSGTRHKLQFHHFFPQERLKSTYSKAEINDICNLAFIAGHTNQSIGAKDPAKYVQEIIDRQGVQALESQCLPTDAQVLDTDRYVEFLATRRQLVASELNRFFGLPSDHEQATQQAPPSPS